VLPPDPVGGAYSAPQGPVAGFKGLLLRRGEGKKDWREGMGPIYVLCESKPTRSPEGVEPFAQKV